MFFVCVKPLNDFISQAIFLGECSESFYKIFVLDFTAVRQKRCDVNFVAPFCRDVMYIFCIMHFAAICSF